MRLSRYILLVLVVASCATAGAQSKVICLSCHGERSSVERCPECFNGAVQCSGCAGLGTILSRCQSCSGNGVVTDTEKTVCPDCGGKRYSRENHPEPCTCRGGKRPVTTRGGSTQYVDCQRCGGKGSIDHYVNVACRRCGASGYSGTNTVSSVCRVCGGNGTVTDKCPTCRGVGSTICHKCGGYARLRVDCPTCRGEGYVYVKD